MLENTILFSIYDKYSNLLNNIGDDMLTYEKIKQKKSQFPALTSLALPEFETLLIYFQIAWDDYGTDFPHPLPKIFNFTYNMHDTLGGCPRIAFRGRLQNLKIWQKTSLMDD